MFKVKVQNRIVGATLAVARNVRIAWSARFHGTTGIPKGCKTNLNTKTNGF